MEYGVLKYRQLVLILSPSGRPGITGAALILVGGFGGGRAGIATKGGKKNAVMTPEEENKWRRPGSNAGVGVNLSSRFGKTSIGNFSNGLCGLFCFNPLRSYTLPVWQIPAQFFLSLLSRQALIAFEVSFFLFYRGHDVNNFIGAFAAGACSYGLRRRTFLTSRTSTIIYSAEEVSSLSLKMTISVVPFLKTFAVITSGSFTLVNKLPSWNFQPVVRVSFCRL